MSTRQLLEDAVKALEYHQAQTRPIENTQRIIAKLREALEAKPETFTEDQWWFRELASLASTPVGGSVPVTSDLKRAVFVVHRLVSSNDLGPWTSHSDGRFITNTDFTTDVVLRVDGDFESEAHRQRWVADLVSRLNTATWAVGK